MTPTRAMSGPLFTVLLLCSANICRSPGAAVVLIDRLGDATASIRVESLGLRVREPKPACREISLLLQPSIGQRAPLTGHRSVQLTSARLASADLVLTATRSQRSEVVLTAPALRAFAFTMREAARLVGGPMGGIDGWYGSPRDRLTMLVTQMNGQRGKQGVVEPAAKSRRFGRGSRVFDPDDIADSHVDPAVSHVDTAALIVAAMTTVGQSLRSVLAEAERPL